MSRLSSKPSALLFTVLLALLGVFAFVPSAQAEDPITISEEVTDNAGVLSSADRTQIQKALNNLADNSELQLFVVFTDTFSGANGQDWSDDTAIKSGLGAKDLLLAVAIDDSLYGLSVDDSSPLSDKQLDQVESAIETQLRRGAWAQAAILGADEIRSTSTGSSGSLGVIVFVVFVAAVVIGIVIWRGQSKTNKTAPGQAPKGGWNAVPTPELVTRASSALVAVDDALTSADQELSFAQAQFGLQATDQFTAALKTGREQVRRAFTMRQQIDNAPQQDEAQTRATLTEIIEVCEKVNAEIEKQSEQFEHLRDLQAKVEDQLTEITQRITEVRARITPAQVSLRQLETTYSAPALQSIVDNPSQVEALLSAAEQAVQDGRADVARDDRATAVARARTALQALAQATTLLDAVESAGADLASSGPRLEEALASISSDLVDAARLAPEDPQVNVAADRARKAIEQGRAAQTGGDPLAALTELSQAEAAIDASLEPYREQAEQAERASRQLDETLGRVDSQIKATNQFIETRRGAVGPDARTRLAEAMRHLGAAHDLRASDPVRSLNAAKYAEQFATQAQQIAQGDVQNWESRQGGGFGSLGSSGSNVGGMILGGILLDSLLGGGSRNRSRSRTRGFGGGFSSGGFGGSSGRGSSSRGGGFSGGSRGGHSSGGGSRGGRSRGGRF